MAAAGAMHPRPDSPSTRAVVQGLSYDGRGIARINSKTVFIEGALPCEEVGFRILRQCREYDEARLQEIHQASPEHVPLHCEHFCVCEGCALQHLPPVVQIVSKQQTLLDNLKRIRDVEPRDILPPLTGPVWDYRRRARLSVHRMSAKQGVFVDFVEKHTPHVTNTNRCETLHPKIGFLIKPFAILIGSLRIAGRIPQVEVAVGEVASVLVLRTLSRPNAADRRRLFEFEQEHDLRFYLQPGGEDTAVPLGGARIDLNYRLPDWNIEIAFEPADFIQVNSEINRQLVNHAITLLQAQPQQQVLDLFCGLSNFTLPSARVARDAVGVDVEAGLISRARANGARNGLANVKFHRADLFADLKDESWLRQTYDRLLLDPPRAGASGILRQMDRKLPPRIVYVSCHPATLARDASILVHEYGYRLLSAGVLDMFPDTTHVESMAVFTREEARA